MTLSPLDDYPVHQVAQVIRHPATSDRNFYDRYYFNCHPCSDRMMLIIGLGQYPNLGVTDAFALARQDRRKGMSRGEVFPWLRRAISLRVRRIPREFS